MLQRKNKNRIHFVRYRSLSNTNDTFYPHFSYFHTLFIFQALSSTFVFFPSFENSSTPV